MTDTDKQRAVQELTDALGKHVRVDFFESIAFNLQAGPGEKSSQMVDAAQVWVPDETRGGNFKWSKLGGVLVSDDRLNSLAQIMRLIGCPKCAHPHHIDTDCGVEVGYDHLNGTHECGCPGEQMPTVGDIADYLEAMNPVEGDNPNRHQIELVLKAIEDLGRG